MTAAAACASHQSRRGGGVGGSTGVEGVVALLEATDDTFPVLDRVVVVVLELGVDPQHV
jgi:hypothetical protein